MLVPRPLPLLGVLSLTLSLAAGVQEPAAVRSAGTITIDASSRVTPFRRTSTASSSKRSAMPAKAGSTPNWSRIAGSRTRGCRRCASSRTGSIVPPSTPRTSTPGSRATGGCAGTSPARRPPGRWRRTGGAPGAMRLVDDAAVDRGHAALARGVDRRLGERTRGRVAVLNEGFWGINVVKGESYDLSLLRAKRRLLCRTDQCAARKRRRHAHRRRRGSPPVLAPPGRSTAPRSRRRAPIQRHGSSLNFGSSGRVWIDFVSLFPKKTWKNRPNGLRVDLAEKIAGAETRIRALAGRLLRRRDHDREPAAVEEIPRAPRGS